MATWIEKILPKIRVESNKKNSQIPEGLWKKCPSCEAILYRPELERTLEVCPKCDHHMRLSARERFNVLFDKTEDETVSYQLIADDVEAVDRLKFKDSKKYKDRLSGAQKTTSEKEAILIAEGPVKSVQMVVAAFEFQFMGGSMGAAVGERFVQGVNRAVEQGLPFVCFSASGGARMQESIFSLLQMAKTSAALETLKEKKLPYISFMTDPVYGGVSASLAMLGDVNLAEPKALIGFTGPRVIKQTVRQELPEGFQRSEFLLDHGCLDAIVHRSVLRETLVNMIHLLMDREPAIRSEPELEPESLEP